MTTRRKITTNKKPALSHYDSADYLRNHGEIAEYLEAAFEEAGDDAAFTVHALAVPPVRTAWLNSQLIPRSALQAESSQRSRMRSEPEP